MAIAGAFLRKKAPSPRFLPDPQELKSVLDALSVPPDVGENPKHFFLNGITSQRAMKGIAERTLSICL